MSHTTDSLDAMIFILVLTFASCTLILLIGCNNRRCQQIRDRQREMRDRQRAMRGRQRARARTIAIAGIAQPEHSQSPSASPRGNTAEESERLKHERRLKILTTLVHKKVFAKGADEELALPHLTADISKRSMHQEDEISEPHNKTNLFVKTFTSWRSSRRMDVGAESEDEESGNLYSPKSCSICLEPYRDGDDICWSQNEKCYHVYHLDCIVDWLMNSDECPLCRANYLNEEGSSHSLSCWNWRRNNQMRSRREGQGTPQEDTHFSNWACGAESECSLIWNVNIDFRFLFASVVNQFQAFPYIANIERLVAIE
jgi:hypothetical protein